MESETEALMIRRGSVDNVQGQQGILVRFRMEDGTEISQDTFAPSITVAALKQRLLAEWPQDREVKPQSVDDIRLLIDRKVLEDSETLAESTSRNLIDDVVTVLAVVMNVRGKFGEAMGPGERGVELRFWIGEGREICQGTYPLSTTVAALKEMLIAEWPQESRVIPESAHELRLLFVGRILNSRLTLAQCIRRSRLEDVAGHSMTMIALVLKGREVFAEEYAEESEEDYAEESEEESAEESAERRTSCQCCMVL